MALKRMDQAVTDDGIAWTNFFNGRLLSGEDLSGEQAAQRRSRRDLGRALGSGVAAGLEVTRSAANSASAPTIHVTAGLAVNRRGQTLSLAQEIELSLIQATDPTSLSAGAFDACTPPQTGVYVAAAGAYLLVVAPASTRQGRAPTSGLGNGSAGCNTRSLVEGVLFRLIPIDLTADELADADHLRSNLAHRCLGTGTAGFRGVAVDPFGAVPDRYGAIDDLRDGFLTDCDVPLGVVVWTADEGVRFVDMWAARRRITRPAGSVRWSALVDDRRRSEAEAMFLQFESQIEDLYGSSADPSTIFAGDRLAYLPPVGVLPIVGGSQPRGFDAATFFGSHATRDVAMTDGHLLRALVAESFSHEPIDLATADPIQLYLIWENFRAVQAGLVAQLALVFASAALPYRGVARFGNARWNLSRFAPTLI
jgi:hypothetical protein